VASRDLDRLCRSLGARYADSIREGRWFTPTRRALDAFFEVVDEDVSGTVSVQLTASACRIGRCRPTVAESSHGPSLVGTI
jgi:argininosuccinate synthase